MSGGFDDYIRCPHTYLINWMKELENNKIILTYFPGNPGKIASLNSKIYLSVLSGIPKSLIIFLYLLLSCVSFPADE